MLLEPRARYRDDATGHEESDCPRYRSMGHSISSLAISFQSWTTTVRIMCNLTFSSAAFDRRARSDRGWYAVDRARLSNVRCNGWLGLGSQACAGGAWKFHQDGALVAERRAGRSGVARASCMLGSWVGWVHSAGVHGMPGFVVDAAAVVAGAVAGRPSDVARSGRWRKGRRGGWCADLWVVRARGCGR